MSIGSDERAARRLAPGERTTRAGRVAAVWLLAAWALAAAAPAAVADWVEVGDAGFLPSNAQATIGSGPLTAIRGSLGNPPASNPFPFNQPLADPDMYVIRLTGGGTFSATTVGQPGTINDTLLYLFDASGRGVYANDDAVGSNTFRSTLPANTPLTPTAPGLYYLLITQANYIPFSFDPLDPNRNELNIFPIFPQRAVYGPTGPGGAFPIATYDGNFASELGSYTIALTGATFAVPEPSSLLLIAISSPALLALTLARARRGA